MLNLTTALFVDVEVEMKHWENLEKKVFIPLLLPLKQEEIVMDLHWQITKLFSISK